MTQVCRVCTHPDRKTIDRQIVSGGNLSEIARKYKLGYDSVWRHSKSHVGAAAARGVRKSEENHGLRLLEDLDDLVITSRRILRKAEEANHPTTALKAVKEVRQSIMSIAQISHAIWEAEQQQTIIEVEAEKHQDNFLVQGYKKLSKAKQDQYAELVFEMWALSGGEFADEEEDPSLVPDTTEEKLGGTTRLVWPDRASEDPDSDPGMEINQDDFSLRPRSVPTRKKKELIRRNPRKPGL